MPTPIDNLTPKSSDKEIAEAISACIGIEMDKGHPQKQAEAMCFDMARRKTGKKISHGGA